MPFLLFLGVTNRVGVSSCLSQAIPYPEILLICWFICPYPRLVALETKLLFQVNQVVKSLITKMSAVGGVMVCRAKYHKDL